MASERHTGLGSIVYGDLRVFVTQIASDEEPTYYTGTMYINTTSDIGTIVTKKEIYVKTFRFHRDDFIYFDGHTVTRQLIDRILREIGTEWSYTKGR